MMTDQPLALHLRPATEADCDLILSFIKELAEYEKLSHEVVADAAMLHEHLFGNRRIAEVIIADYEEQAVGFALFFYNFSTFLGRPGMYLEDLYVQPAYRGKGIGEALLKYLAKLAVDRECGRLEWSVLNWNEPAISFYERMGAVPMDEWTVYRLTGSALTAAAERSTR